ncbi:hypothetical protein [Novosphingobium silvae]
MILKLTPVREVFMAPEFALAEMPLFHRHGVFRIPPGIDNMPPTHHQPN